MLFPANLLTSTDNTKPKPGDLRHLLPLTNVVIFDLLSQTLLAALAASLAESRLDYDVFCMERRQKIFTNYNMHEIPYC